MSVSGPDECPACQEDLTALGRAGRCPSCGFEFDERTLVWRAARTWQYYAAIYGLGGLATGLLVAVLERVAAGHAENALLPIVTALTVAFGGLLLHRVLTGRLSGRFVAVSPAGVLLGLRRGEELVPWDDVRRVVVRGRVPRLERQSTSIAVALEDVFENDEELGAFQGRVSEYKGRAAEGPA